MNHLLLMKLNSFTSFLLVQFSQQQSPNNKQMKMQMFFLKESALAWPKLFRSLWQDKPLWVFSSKKALWGCLAPDICGAGESQQSCAQWCSSITHRNSPLMGAERHCRVLQWQMPERGETTNMKSSQHISSLRWRAELFKSHFVLFVSAGQMLDFYMERINLITDHEMSIRESFQAS